MQAVSWRDRGLSPDVGRFGMIEPGDARAREDSGGGVEGNGGRRVAERKDGEENERVIRKEGQQSVVVVTRLASW